MIFNIICIKQIEISEYEKNNRLKSNSDEQPMNGSWQVSYKPHKVLTPMHDVVATEPYLLIDTRLPLHLPYKEQYLIFVFEGGEEIEFWLVISSTDRISFK